MRQTLLRILLILCLPACVHTPDARHDGGLDPGAPSPAEILGDLNGPDRAIQNLESNGTIRMQLPGEAGTQRFETGRIQFQAPAQFLAQGRKLNVVVRVYSEGDAFLLELPAENTFYTGSEGDRFEDIALDIAPSEIFRELFLIGVLDQIDPDKLEVESFDAAANRAVLALRGAGRRAKVARRLTVEKGPEGWTVVESQVYDDAGELIGQTACEEYLRLGDVLLPSRVTATFPRHEAEMSFFMRPNTARVNQTSPLTLDSIDAKRAELLEKGYREIQGDNSKGFGR